MKRFFFAALGLLLIPSGTLFANVDEISYSGDAYDIGSYGLTISFSTDGTKMYRPASFGTNTLYQYTLSTPWDITTAVSNGSANLSSNGITGIYFKTDGTKLYALHFYSGVVYQYTLSTPWDITTASSDSIYKSLGTGNHYTFTMKQDGTAIYAVNSYTHTVKQFNISSAWDLSTVSANADATLNIVGSGNNYYKNGAAFSGNGTKLYLITTASNSTGATLLQYNLSTPWDISTGVINGSNFDLTSQSSGMRGLFIDSDDRYLFTRSESSGNYNVFKYEFTPPDFDAPIISNLDTDIDSTEVIVTWTTDEATDSNVYYGVNNDRPHLITNESATTTHSITIDNLKSCSRYSYQVVSSDTSSNIATSSASNFETTGCSGESSIVQSNNKNVTIVDGGDTNLDTMVLDIPPHFTNASSADSVIFQINKIDENSFTISAGNPAGKTRAGNNIYNLKSFVSATSSIAVFVQPITVTMSYADEEINNLNEDSLSIYRYDGSSWYQLNNCNVNKTENIVSCSTSNFSDFAIFGDQIEVIQSQQQSRTHGRIKYGCKDKKASNYDYFSRHKLELCEYDTKINFVEDIAVVDLVEKNKSELLRSYNSDLELPESTTVLFGVETPIIPNSVKDLEYGMEGDDVYALQNILINEGYSIPAGATGYFGLQTQYALDAYQVDNDIAPRGGYFGPITRSQMKYSNVSGFWW